MARLSRVEVFDPDEIAVVHVMSRVVRRACLLGYDKFSGKNFDHRRSWVEHELERAAGGFGIDLIAYSLMSNHFHLVLRSRPDVVAHWDDSEVARRWLLLCPVGKNKDGSPKAPTEAAINKIRNNSERLREIRRRLSDISWWMRLVCQRIAQRANAEDECKGKFWESRYQAVRLLDEASILACAVYVDLNPIRAALAETIEDSRYTSAQRRVQSLINQVAVASASSTEMVGSATEESILADAILSPVQVNAGLELANAGDVELANQSDCVASIGPQLSSSGRRCSDKGFAEMTATDYLQLLDWTARSIAPGKVGCTPLEAPPIFERIGLRAEVWCDLVANFGVLFSHVAGKPEHVDTYRSRVRQQQFRMKPEARQLLAA